MRISASEPSHDLVEEATIMIAQMAEPDARRCIEFMRTYAYKPRTELGERLMKKRREYIAAGGRLYSFDEINDEVASMRRRDP